MFDHLDDTLAAPTDERFRNRTMRRGRRLRRRRRVAAGATACGSTLLLGAAGMAWWGKEKLDDIDRVEIAGPTLAPPAEPGEPTTFLLVGSDGAEGMEADDPVAAGRNADSSYADAIMLVRADPTGEGAHFSVLSVPRDLWVEDVDGAGTPGRINQALAGGGPDNLVRVVSSTLDLDVHHYIELDMDGFRDLVDAAGGVDVAFAAAVRDPSTGFVASTSCQHLDGTQALGLVRSRHLEVQQPDGSWVVEPSGDIGRIARQRALAHIMVASLLSDDWRSPQRLVDAVDLLADHATLDDELSVPDLIGWGQWLGSSAWAGSANVDLPVVPSTQADQSVVALAPGWQDAVAGFVSGSPPPSGPTDEEAIAAYAAVAPPHTCGS
jgi:LCP family protein required for cell wall assembly